MTHNLPEIQKPDQKIKSEIQHKLDNKTKPVDSLGYLEELALKIGLIQQTVNPVLSRPTMLTIAADHEIVDEGVSCAPSEITWQQVVNFVNGGGGIGLFCDIHGLDLWIADAGVNHIFKPHPRLIDAKVRMGTRNFHKEPAMTKEECDTAFKRGRDIVRNFHLQGTNIIGFGEMGIGNSSPASALLSIFTDTPVEECVGPGGGLKPEGVNYKAKVIKEAIEKHGKPKDAFEVLRLYGGLEIAMIAGGMYEAAINKMIVIVDGYITTSAALTVYNMNKNAAEYFIFSHISGEGGHKIMLNHMNARPLLNLDLRLGEGTGAALAYPIIKTAAELLNRMTSFEEAKVFNSSELTRL